MRFVEGEVLREGEEPMSRSRHREDIEALYGQKHIEEPVCPGIEEAAWRIFFEVADKLEEEAFAAAAIALDFDALDSPLFFPQEVHAEVLEARLLLHIVYTGLRALSTHPLAGHGDSAVGGAHNGMHAIAFQSAPLSY
jgi:hypothetical protein